MVAGAKNIRIWKPENQAIRVSSDYIISWVKQKKEFSRGVMESSTDLTQGQAEWWIKELIKKGVIKKTRRTIPNKIGKGKPQTIYKYIG